MQTVCPLAPEALAQCQSILRVGSKSFAAASWLLPRHLRGPAAAIYAFCREADDAVDRATAPTEALVGVNRRLSQIYGEGEPIGAVDQALAQVVRAYRLPKALFRALLEGFAWDAEGRHYDSLDAVRAYAARVAGSVGVIMARLMGVEDPALLARACDLGIAMQLTNIARDVAEDAALGRCYLPGDWLREAGLAPAAWLQAPGPSGALTAVVQRLLAAADDLYERSDAGIAGLPQACRGGIYAARLIYAEIGTRLQGQGCDPFRGRTIVPWYRKLWLLARGLWARWGGPVGREVHLMAPALAEAVFLLTPSESLARAPDSWL